MKLPQWLADLGFVGERKAVALACLGFYATLFAMLTLAAVDNLPEWVPCFLGLAICYGIGFFAVAADWFWGRWYAIGLGQSGLYMALLAMVTTRELNPQLVLFGVMHGAVALCLLGSRMVEAFEGRKEWRERWQLNDYAVENIKRTVMRAAASLPYLIMFALAPREGAEMLILTAAVLGLWATLRMRTWGVLALGGAGVAALVASATATDLAYASSLELQVSRVAFGLCGAGFLLAAALPFARQAIAFLRRHPA